MTWHKHRHVMCRVASFCCSNDLRKESRSVAYLTILMTQCGRAAKVYVWNVRQRNVGLTSKRYSFQRT